MSVSPELIKRYAVQVPRYTSYPTAPHFHDRVDAPVFGDWLGTLEDGARLSLYAHIPFCDTLCWFCGCHTKQTLRYDPVAAYLKVLKQEIALVRGAIRNKATVEHLHFGGGSPTMLVPDDIRSLMATFHEHFNFAADVEIAIEIDPRDVTPEKLDALCESGLTRASIGVQDFNPEVQNAINRMQSAEMTSELVQDLRNRGIKSINLDVLYGLPLQSATTITNTIASVVAMMPDRIALFGYAHVPWMKTHQTMINQDDLPDVIARYELAELAAKLLCEAGYKRIGFDHFALPHDLMAIASDNQKLFRNFQGYATEKCDALIGLGASSVSELPQGYAQNVTSTGDYMHRIKDGHLATVKGFAVQSEDRVRRAFIEKLLCDFAIDTDNFAQSYGAQSACLVSRAALLAQSDRDGLVNWSNGIFNVTEKGRPFVRTIAAQFDAYMGQGKARHSLSI